jgi:hypothetical protein
MLSEGKYENGLNRIPGFEMIDRSMAYHKELP